MAHELPGGELGALLESGEASHELRRLAVTHASGRRFVLVGLGAREELDAERARCAAAAVDGRARELGATTLCWEVPHHVGDDVVAGLVEGTLLHAYRFDRYRAAEPGAERRAAASQRSPRRLDGGRARGRGRRARRTAPATSATHPPTTCRRRRWPTTRVELRRAGSTAVACRSSTRRRSIDAGMGAFTAVAQGSDQEARLIRLDYDGPDGERRRGSG